jgi:hypothetical protein
MEWEFRSTTNKVIKVLIPSHKIVLGCDRSWNWGITQYTRSRNAKQTIPGKAARGFSGVGSTTAVLWRLLYY